MLVVTCDGVTADLPVTIDIPVAPGGKRAMHTAGAADPFYYLLFVDLPTIKPSTDGMMVTVTFHASATTAVIQIPMHASFLPQQSVHAGAYVDQIPITGSY